MTSGMVENSKGSVNGILAGLFGALGGICGKVSFDKELVGSILKPKVLAQISKLLPKTATLPASITIWMGQILQVSGNYREKKTLPPEKKKPQQQASRYFKNTNNLPA